MGSSWNEKPLGELISYISRGVIPKYVKSADENAVIVLGQRCVRNSGLDISQSRFHDLSAKKVKDEKFVRMHDILITAPGVGCAGRVSQVLDSLPYGTLTDSHVLTLRAKDIDPVYLGYFIKSKQYMLELMAEGSTGQTEMNKTRVQEEIVVTYPMDASVQKAIADTLRDFDEKIEINKQLNDYLAELCEAIASKYCEAGDACLNDVCCQVTERCDCGDADLSTYVSTESLLQNKQGRQLASSFPVTGKVTCYKAGDTLVSNIRPYFKKVWYAPFDGTCSSDVLVFRANNTSMAPYLHACLRQDRFFDHVMRGAKGTKMPRGDKKQMMEFVVSPECELEDLALLNAATQQIAANASENESLAELRDTLLPKLMSGEIDVSKVDLTPLNNHLAES